MVAPLWKYIWEKAKCCPRKEKWVENFNTNKQKRKQQTTWKKCLIRHQGEWWSKGKRYYCWPWEDRISTNVHTADNGGSHTKADGYFQKELWTKAKTPAWVGKKHEEEGEVELKCCELTTTFLFLITPVLLRLSVDSKVRNKGLKVSWRKKG